MRLRALIIIALLLTTAAIQPVFAQIPDPEHFQFTLSNENHSLLALEARLNGELLAEGDEIGIFNPRGTCSGASVVFDNEGSLFPVGLAAMGDNTGNLGFRAGEQLSFRLWQRATDREVEAQVEYVEGDQVYTTNGWTMLNLSANLEGPPEIQLSEEAHDYGDVLVDGSSEWTFTITNAGIDQLDVSSIESDEQAFTTNFADGGVSLQVNERTDVIVVFSPTEERQYNGVLTINSNDPERGQVAVSLTGNGTIERIPDIAIDAGSFDFGQVEVDLTDSQDLTVSNTGTGDLTISSMSADNGVFTTNFNDAVTLTPGDSRVFAITFAPDAVGQYQATLTIVSDDPDEQEVTVALAGEGFIPPRPDITLEPASIDYGEVVAGEVVSRSLTIGNAGDRPLTVSAVTSDNEVFYTNFDQGEQQGPHFNYTMSDANHSILIDEATINGASLEENDEIGVFTPGGVCAGAVIIVPNEGELFPAGLAAWGDASGQAGFRNNEAMSFRFWDYSARREIAADANIVAGDANWIGNGFTELTLSNHQQRAPQHAFEQIIQPGDALEVTVFFAPADIAEYAGALTISSNDPRTPEVTVDLAGVGVPLPPDIELPAMAHDFGNVLVDRAATWQFNLNNVGVRSLAGEMWVEGDDYSVTVGQFNIQGGTSVAVRVIFAPTDIGERNGVLRITSNDPDEGDLSVELIGSGVQPAPNIALPEQAHDFGQLFLGDERTWAMTIRNDGEVRLDVSDVTVSGQGFTTSFQQAFSLNPGASTNITVHFQPQEEREYNETLTISSNDPDSPEFHVSLAGRGAVDRAPDINMIADLYDFQAVTVGESRTLNVSGENIGNDTLHITQAWVTGNGFSVDFDGEIVVDPESDFTIPVTFAPGEVRDFTETLGVTSDDPDEGEVFVTLIGRAIAQGEHFAFAITADNMSAIVEEALLNGEPLSPDDEIAVFTEAGICAGAAVIADEWPVGIAIWGDDPNEAGMQGFRDGEVIAWKVWDRTVGREFFAQPEFSEGEGFYRTNSFAVLCLSARAVPAGHLRVAPLALDFGRILIESASDRSFTLTNFGDGNLQIEGIEAEAPFSVNLANAFVIEPGRSVQVQATFSPQQSGEFASSITVHSNDPDRPQIAIEVAGVAVEASPPQLAVSEAVHDFGTMRLGGIVNWQLVVTNEGGSVLHVESVALEDAGFTVTPNAAFNLDIGEVMNLQVTFSPAEEADYEGHLILTSDDPDNGQTTVTLIGRGVVPEFYWFFQLTDNNMSLLINDVTLNGEQLPINTEVGVFTPNGVNAGVTRISEYPTGVAAWGDDAATRDVVEGFRDGEEISYRVWNPETQQELTAIPNYSEGNGQYSMNGFAVLTLECQVGAAEHFGYSITDVNHSLLVIDAMLDGEPLAVGDEAAAFTPAGVCAGSVRLEEDGSVAFGIAAWADDNGTQIVEGFRAGEQLLFRFWDASARSEYMADPIWEEGPRVFTANGFTVLHLDYYGFAQPQIEVETLHDFGSVAIGTEATWDMVIRNGGDADLVISAITSPAAPFSHEAVDSYTLAAGESQQFTIHFNPAEPGDFVSSLIVRSNDRLDREVTVNLVGSAFRPNEPPEWVSAPTRLAVDEGEQLLVTYRASDPNGDQLVLTINRGDLPEAPSFRDNGDGTAAFMWTPAFNTAGVYNFSVFAADAEFSIRTDVTLTVNDINRPPIWVEYPEFWDGAEGEQIQFTVRSEDQDGDAYSLQFEFVTDGQDPAQAPEFSDQHDGSAIFSWTPGYEDDGDYSAIFHLISDHPISPDVILDVPISVANVNRPPQIINDIADVQLNEDAGRTDIADLDAVFGDPDGEALSFAFDGAEELNLALNQDNVLSLQSAANYFGESNVVVTASDGQNAARISFKPVQNAAEGNAIKLDANRAIRSLTEKTLLSETIQFGPRRDAESNVEFMVTIVSVNDAPDWIEGPEARIEVSEGDLIQFNVSASDVEQDQLSLTLARVNLPQAASLTDHGDGTATFEWQTDSFSSGEYRPELVASDGAAATSVEFIIVVQNVNRDPRWEEIPQQVRVDEGDVIEFTVRGSDPDNDRLAITLAAGLPQAAGLVDHQDGSATFTWQTAFDQAGEYAAVLTISDGEARVEARVPIVIGNVNRAPEVVNAVADLELQEDAQHRQIADLDDVFRDLDGDALRYTFEGEQELGLSLDGDNVLSTQPTANWNGSAEVTLNASDGVASVNEAFTVTVVAENDDPTFVNPTREATVNEGDRIQFVLRADDVDLAFEGDDLSIYMVNEAGVIALGASFRDNNDNTASFDWQTDNADGGVYRPVIRVEDRAGATQDVEIVLTINNINLTPEISQPSDQGSYEVSVNENEELVVEFAARDADEQQLAWNISDQDGLPQGWEFADHRDGTATFRWTPGFDARRQAYTPTFQVADPEGAVDRIRVIITVNNTNREPAIEDPTDQDRYRVEVSEGQELSFRVFATDPDGDELNYFITQNDLPDGFDFAPDGDGYLFTWTPGFDAAQDEPYSPTFGVQDQESSDEFFAEITVRNVNRNPVIDRPADAEVAQVSVDENQELVISLHANDLDGDALTWSLPDDGGAVGYQWDANSAIFTWTPDFDAAREEPYIPVFLVTDAGGLTDQIRVEITVGNVNRAPEAVGQIGDVVVDEDPGRVQIVDLRQIFADPDGDPLTFGFAGDSAGFGMALEQDAILIINPRLNYNLAAGAVITVTASDPSNEQATRQFRVTINPINDAPGAFDLAAPDNGAVLSDYRTTFRWTRSVDPDADQVGYIFSFSFIDAPIDTIFNYGPLNDTLQALDGLDTLVAQYGLGDSLRVRWWVSSTDGQVMVESSSRRIVVIPPLSAPNEDAIPTELTLRPNYPNPFNPETRVAFALPIAASVKLAVIDSRGRQIAVIADGAYPAGNHAAMWRADTAPAGIYFFILQTETERRVIKGTLLK